MQNIRYGEFLEAFDAAGVSRSPPEIHGMITGMLCANPRAGELQREAAYREWLAGDLTPELLVQLNTLSEATIAELDEFSDFQFRILMPDDDEDINSRSQALTSFCAGFLSGFGAHGVGEEISEVFADFERIAAVKDEVEDSEENEADLFEIVEYIRVSVLLIFAEAGARP